MICNLMYEVGRVSYTLLIVSNNNRILFTVSVYIRLCLCSFIKCDHPQLQANPRRQLEAAGVSTSLNVSPLFRVQAFTLVSTTSAQRGVIAVFACAREKQSAKIQFSITIYRVRVGTQTMHDHKFRAIRQIRIESIMIVHCRGPYPDPIYHECFDGSNEYP